VRKVLIVAFHFPPLRGGSGVHRTLNFVKHLPQFGWQPLVLAPIASAYERVGDELIAQIPREAVVRRAWAVDSGRLLGVLGGRYPDFLGLPDRWASWRWAAIPAGSALIRRHRPDAIFSTYPIATAHRIGLALARSSRLPWVADFRDLMLDDTFPVEMRKRRVFGRIEAQTVRAADACLFTAPSAVTMCRERYPDVAAGKLHLLPNGYDEDDFATLVPDAGGSAAPGRPLTLTHSGVLYPDARNPARFFAAIERLKSAGVSRAKLRVVLRATKHDRTYRPMIDAHGIGDIVTLAPPVPYAEALAEMLASDGLLLFQGPTCNHQIPAKLYEYIRAGRPIIALTDSSGDTARVLRELRGPHVIADMENHEEIASRLVAFIEDMRAGRIQPQDPSAATGFSRRERTHELAQMLANVVAVRGTAPE
jgi:glycosyltransferase involved in cell wall biosynthesis